MPFGPCDTSHEPLKRNKKIEDASHKKIHRQKNKNKMKSSSQPFLSRINSKYDLVIQGPLIPNLNASSPTVYAKEENQDGINFVVQ